MIDILLADDFPLVREGVKEILTRDSLETRVVAEASTAGETMQHISQHEDDIDLLILDISMSDNCGLETLKKIKKEYPNLDVLILSMHHDRDFALEALKEGASGYIMKSNAPEDLVAAIKQIVMHRTKYVSTEIREFVFQNIDKNNNESLRKLLSDIEFKVMCLLAANKDILNIAIELGISVSAVRSYRSRIMRAMGWDSVPDIKQFAM